MAHKAGKAKPKAKKPKAKAKPKRRNKPRYTAKQVEAALRATGCIYSHAALELGCAPNTVKAYIERYPSLAGIAEEIGDSVLDLAESRLMEAIKDKTSKSHMTAVIFFLKCKGKSRGYSETIKIEPVGGGVLVVPGVLSPEEWQEKVARDRGDRSKTVH